jgi:N-acetylmuramoyl-L-alanine amidase CwlA
MAMKSYRNPNAQFLGSPNYSLNRDGHNLDSDPRWIVMHTMVGDINSANARFQQAAQKASAHYGVGLDGRLVQWVDEKDASWAAGNYEVNLDAINIEHADGYSAARPNAYNEPRPEALKATSASLVADICQRYGIPCDRAHIRKHKEVSDVPTACPDSLEVDEIIARAQQLGVAGGEDMTPDQDAKLTAIANALGVGESPSYLGWSRDVSKLLNQIVTSPAGTGMTVKQKQALKAFLDTLS